MNSKQKRTEDPHVSRDSHLPDTAHNTTSNTTSDTTPDTTPDTTRELYYQLLERAAALYGVQLKHSVEDTVNMALRAAGDQTTGSRKAGSQAPESRAPRGGRLSGSDGILFFSAPGRVNLIGEHTDYNNCPVLPVAVDREILAVAIPHDEGVIRAADLNPGYDTIEFSLSEYDKQASPVKELVPYETGNWGNYVKAAVNGLLGTDYSLERGYSIVFVSTIPQAAGMSSSSALVVLFALAFMETNGISLRNKADRLALAELCRKAEWYTGSMGGGMDQAAILLGQESHASKIDFAPLTVREVPFPRGYTVVVTHSTIEAHKTLFTMDLYNRRSIECRIAAAAAGRVFREKYGITGIGFIGDITPGKTGLTEKEIDTVVSGLFHTDYYSLEDAAELLGESISSVKEHYCLRKDGSDFPIPEEGFKLYQRFHHVWSEWNRVEQAVEMLRSADMDGFGRLMEASHRSCRFMHEISCTELDRMTELALEAGALGSRLTGAGFGGCAVNLVKDSDVSAFIRKIKKSYYLEYLGMPEEESIKYIFSVHPVHGASLVGIVPQEEYSR